MALNFDLSGDIKRLESRGQHYQHLVNNAGVAKLGVVETVPLDAVCDVFEISLFGV